MDLATLDEFARTHNGLVTRAVVAKKLSDRAWYRAIERGEIEPLHRGVGRLHGTLRTPAQSIHAAVLAAGPGAMASHRSAAQLWGVPRPDDDPIDVILGSRTSGVRVRGVNIHRPSDRGDLNPGRRNGVPLTNILRTLCDLGAFDPDAVVSAVGHVVTSELASAAALAAAVRRHGRRGRPGVPALRAALETWTIDGKPADSLLEPAMRRLLADHGLPPAEFHPVLEGYEVDFRIVASPIVLECDGWSTHGLDKSRFERDRARDAELSARGWVVVRFSYRQITRSAGRVADRIRRNVHRWAPHLLAEAS